MTSTREQYHQTDPVTGLPVEIETARTLPVTSCYWAILSAPARTLRTLGPLPTGLLADLADQVPIDLGELHIVAAPIDADAAGEGGGRGGQQRILVCAVPGEILRDLPPNLLRLCPESIPAEFGLASTPAPQAFNLLIGEFRPRALVAAQSARHMLWAATFLLCALLASIGLARRSSHLRAQALAANAHTETLLAQCAPDKREQTLSDLVTRAREVSAAATRTQSPRDAARDLAAVLASWPVKSQGARPQAISVSPEGANLAVTVEGDAAAFLKSFTPPSSFTLDEPRLVNVGALTRLNLRLRPVASDAGGTP